MICICVTAINPATLGLPAQKKSFVNIAGQKSDKIVVKAIAQAEIKSGMMAGS